MSLRTKNRKLAERSSASISSRLDEYWMSLRIAKLNIPSHQKEQAASLAAFNSPGFENYHALKGIGKDALFLGHHHVLLIMPSKHLEIDVLVNTPQWIAHGCAMICLNEACHQAVLNASLHPSGHYQPVD